MDDEIEEWRAVSFVVRSGSSIISIGVNTGYGASANTRPKHIEEHQRCLLRVLQYGILTEPSASDMENHTVTWDGEGSKVVSYYSALPLDEPGSANSMPESWARSSMLIRLNSLISGMSGVHASTIRTLAELLQHGIAPMIPLRGSISASGDLSPLSYIGGAMQGNTNIQVFYREQGRGKRSVIGADRALALANIRPVQLKAKEGLAIVNGTAVSAGVASLALHEALNLVALSQILTAMSVEALLGTDESFDPFFAKVRSHPGQQESAQNIFAFLRGSKLIDPALRNDNAASLPQDRYSIRTASQWIGPVSEDFLLAHSQVSIEINSVTDNPLIDTATDKILQGGNFQAKSITAACEKLRVGLHDIGRMLYMQCSEMINPATSRGLPPNLVADEPSESFLWKGQEVFAAALVSELGFLANPMAPHVQNAEMGNQSLNSLALLSARYTHEAAACLAQLAAVHLVSLCQALDLRALQIEFLEKYSRIFDRLIVSMLSKHVGSRELVEDVKRKCWKTFLERLDANSSMDTSERILASIDSLQLEIFPVLATSGDGVEAIRAWRTECATAALRCWQSALNMYTAQGDATDLLGLGAQRMYKFVRKDLEIPFIRESTFAIPEPALSATHHNDARDTRVLPTIGGVVTKVYQSMRNGKCYSAAMECLANVSTADS